MQHNRKRVVRPGPFNIWIYGRGLIRGYIISLIFFLIVAIIITYTSVSENIIPFITSIIMIIGISYASIYATVNLKNKGWLHGGIIGLIYIFILLLLSLLLIKDYSFDKVSLYKVIVSGLAGIISGMLGVNIK